MTRPMDDPSDPLQAAMVAYAPEAEAEVPPPRRRQDRQATPSYSVGAGDLRWRLALGLAASAGLLVGAFAAKALLNGHIDLRLRDVKATFKQVAGLWG